MAMRIERQHFQVAVEASQPAVVFGAQADVVLATATMAERTYLNIVREWGRSIESGDEYMRGHGARVAEHAIALATALKVDRETRMAIFAGAYLHGVGRLRVPRTILNKPGMLSLAERAAVQQIPVWGTEILSKIALPWNVTPIVRWYNERVDGTGYPEGLRTEEIPVGAQIVGIANVFDAMISARAHRPALTPARAVRELAQVSGRWSEDVFGTYSAQLQVLYRGSLVLA
jgi:HD-GYP domain-containing protein (c-di-GMP phosphodiesterase class II)